jgi:hypothetical protein
VAGATRLIAGASGATLDGIVRFQGELFITAGAFAPSQVFYFGSLAYVVDYYGELRPLNGTAPTGREHPASPPPPGLLGADLKVLA